MKSKKWWKSVFYFIVDQAIIATFRIWQQLRPLSKKSTRDCVAAIIQSTRDTVDTASQTTFNPTKLTKNQNVNEIDHEFRQDEKIKGTKKKGCFRCRFLRRNEKRSET